MAVARWTTVDPLAEKMSSWSPYNYTFGNPIVFTDPTGMAPEGMLNLNDDDLGTQKSGRGNSEPSQGKVFIGSNGGGGTDPIYTATGATVTVTATRIGGPGSKDQSAERYGYSGSFADWQAQYGTSGWSHTQETDYWSQTHSASFANYVAQQDAIERARIAVQRMRSFAFWFAMEATVLAPSQSSFANLSPRGFQLSVSNYYITPSRLMSNPNMLSNISLQSFQNRMSGFGRWQMGNLGKGRSMGKGMSLRELNPRGTDFTHRYIQYHPGSPRHFGGAPYWKISGSTRGGVIRYPL